MAGTLSNQPTNKPKKKIIPVYSFKLNDYGEKCKGMSLKKAKTLILDKDPFLINIEDRIQLQTVSQISYSFVQVDVRDLRSKTYF